MSDQAHFPNQVTTWDFVRQLFDPTDAVAVVLINNSNGITEQKIRTASQVASPRYQAHLRARNAQGYSVHLGMNPMLGNFAVKLQLPIEQLESVRTTVNSTAALSDYRAHFTWLIQASTPDEAKKIAHARAKSLLNELSKIRNIAIKTFPYSQQPSRLGRHTVRVIIPAEFVNAATHILGTSALNTVHDTALIWNVRAATISDAKTKAESLQEEIEKHLSGITLAFKDGSAATLGIPGLRGTIYQDHSRLKEDVREVRRLYLDIDYDGPDHLKRIFADANAKKIPIPNYVINTSPNKFQVVWTVKPGLSQAQAEDMLKTLAREYGGDSACSDVSRVLRLPGLQNKKFQEYMPVKGECWSNEVYLTTAFAYLNDLQHKHAEEDAQSHSSSGQQIQTTTQRVSKRNQPSQDTQSHKDWHYCCQEAERAIYRSPSKQVHENLEKTYDRLYVWLVDNCSDNHKSGRSSRPEQYASRTIKQLRRHIAPKIQCILQKRRANSGLDEADRKTAQLAGATAQCYPANPQSGLYTGTFIGETSRHYLQSLTPKTVIAHKKDNFTQPQSRVPMIGHNYTIRYSNHQLVVREQPVRQEKGMVHNR